MKMVAMKKMVLATMLLVMLAGCGNSWVEIEPGLKYLDEVVGTGDEVLADSFVSIQYTGYLWAEGEKDEKGEKFDSSWDRNEAFSTFLGQSRVIEGWDKGVPGMKVGGKRTLIIGYEMAYGEAGRPPKIPAKANLVFDVEVVALPKVTVEIISEGSGPVVGIGDQINVHYTGWIWDEDAKTKGAQFDSSKKTGRPFPLQLGAGQVIPGWEMGLTGLKKGTKAKIIIPPALGYGSRGAGAVIVPNSHLIFEVEIQEDPDVEIQILQQGTGPVAAKGDRVEVHYTGWLWKNGTKCEQFDSSLDRGKPIQFTLGTGRVIKGWDQGLEGLKVGTKARLIIPSVLGYGKRASGSIPANSDLCFDVELVGIKGK